MATEDTTNPLATALATHGASINGCVIKTDHIDAVLDAALNSFGNPTQVNSLVQVAKDQLSAVNAILNDLDADSCALEETASNYQLQEVKS